MKTIEKDGMEVFENHVAFWGGPLSNFYPCKIQGIGDLHDDTIWYDLEFKSSEQCFMWQKANFFSDKEMANKILEAKTPKEAKMYGRQVKGFDEETWENVREEAMYNAIYEKFSQNEDLKEFLLSDEFNGKGFVEGSPIDRIWGVGIHFQSPNIDDESQWNGLNLLGKALDKLRLQLISE